MSADTLVEALGELAGDPRLEHVLAERWKTIHDFIDASPIDPVLTPG